MSGFRLTRTIRIGNRLVTPLIRAGLPLGPMALLTVSGRKSGLPRTTPVALLPQETGWRLIAPYGVVDWVKNLRAAGIAVVTRRGRKMNVEAEELTPEEAAPQLRDSLLNAGPITRRVVGPYLTVTTDAPLVDWIAEARRHPVFIIRPVDNFDASAPAPTFPRLSSTLTERSSAVDAYLSPRFIQQRTEPTTPMRE
jgi:deazaflavin-dependent oxidoreductase (nitroreductase family)